MQNVLARAFRTIALIAASLSSAYGYAAADRVTEQMMIGDVPILVSRPATIDARTRVVLLYHGFGAPASPRDLEKAVPLSGSNIIAAYVNMPLVADRLPAGGVDELMRIQRTDFVNGLFYRSIAGAVAEMPSIVNALGKRYQVDTTKGIGLFGFSAGGSAVLLAMIDSEIPIAAAVVVNAPFSIQQNVKSWERALKRAYQWDADSLRVAEHFDVARHADRIASRSPGVAMLVLQSASDELLDAKPSEEAVAALRAAYKAAGSHADIELRVLERGTHNFSAAETEIDQRATDWLQSHLRAD
jgi:predicted esterase